MSGDFKLTVPSEIPFRHKKTKKYEGIDRLLVGGFLDREASVCKNVI